MLCHFSRIRYVQVSEPAANGNCFLKPPPPPCLPEILCLCKHLRRKASSPGARSGGVLAVSEANQGITWPQNWKVMKRKGGRQCCFMLPAGRELSASEMERLRENPVFLGANLSGGLPWNRERR